MIYLIHISSVSISLHLKTQEILIYLRFKIQTQRDSESNTYTSIFFNYNLVLLMRT